MESPCWVVKRGIEGLAGVQHMCGTSNPQSPASRAVAAFQRRADPLAAVFQLRRLCEHRSIPAEAGSSGAVVPPTVSESAPARNHRTSSHHKVQVSVRGPFVSRLCLGLLLLGWDSLTAERTIVCCAAVRLESSEWRALALLVSVSIGQRWTDM